MDKFQEYVKEMIEDINLLDYVDKTELQVLKDKYVDENGDDIDYYEFAQFLDENGVYVFELVETAISEMIDTRLTYTQDCVDLLQLDLVEAFYILNDAMHENPDVFDMFDARSFAIALCHHVAWNELRTELETTFIANALNNLK